LSVAKPTGKVKPLKRHNLLYNKDFYPARNFYTEFFRL